METLLLPAQKQHFNSPKTHRLNWQVLLCLLLTFLIVGFVSTVKAQNPLDKVGLTSENLPAAAYSLRKVSSQYNGEAVVLKFSDNFGTSIGFTPSGELDTVALNTLLSQHPGDAYVTAWFDQSGNGRTMREATGHAYIAKNSKILGANGRPAVYFNNASLKAWTGAFITNGATMAAFAKGEDATPSTLISKTGVGESDGAGGGTIVSGQGQPAPFIFVNSNGRASLGDPVSGNNNEDYTSSQNFVSSNMPASIYLFTLSVPSPHGSTLRVYNDTSFPDGFTSFGAYADRGGPLMIGGSTDEGFHSNFYVSELLLFDFSMADEPIFTLKRAQNLYFRQSTLAGLASLTSSAGNFNPAFQAEKTTYNLIVPNGTTTVQVTATPKDPNSTIGFEYDTPVSGTTPFTFSMDVSGGVDQRAVVVTSVDGRVSLPYLVIASTPSAATLNYSKYGQYPYMKFAVGYSEAPVQPYSVSITPPVYGAPSTLAITTAANSRVRVDPQGNVYTINPNGTSVDKYDANGNLLASATATGNPIVSLAQTKSGDLYGQDNSGQVFQMNGEPMAGRVLFTAPASGAIVLDTHETTYIPGTDRIYKFIEGGPAGEIWTGTAINSIATDNSDRIYVPIGNDIFLLSQSGETTTPLAHIAQGIKRISIDPSGNIYVVTQANSVIRVDALGGAQQVVASGFDADDAVADGKGNVYITSGTSLKKVKPTGGYYVNRPLPEGFTFDINSGAIGGVPKVPTPMGMDYRVTAYTDTTAITADMGLRVYSSDATFTSLTVDSAGLYPAFDPNVTDYSVIANLGATSATFTPEIGNPDASATLNFSEPVISGQPITIPLNGDETIVSISVAPAWGMTKVYYLRLKKSKPLVLSYGGNISLGRNTQVKGIVPTSESILPVTYADAEYFNEGFSNGPKTVIDTAGNIYTAGDDGTQLFKYPADGSGRLVLTTPSKTRDLAVDKAGNVYGFSDTEVFKIPVGATTATQVIASGSAKGAVDSQGNIYVADASAGTVKKYAANGSFIADVVSGLEITGAVAIDAYDNLYVSDQSGNGLFKLPKGQSALTTFSARTANVANISFDASGSYIYAVTNTGAVIKFKTDGTDVATIIEGLSPKDPPFPPRVAVASFTVDKKGDAYIGYAATNIKKAKATGGYYLNKPLPEGLSFNINDGSISGTPTVNSAPVNYTVGAYNGQNSVTANFNLAVISNANLAAIVTDAKITPRVHPDSTKYTLLLSPGATRAEFEFVPADKAASVTLNGLPFDPGKAIDTAIAGTDIPFTFAITSADGSVTKTYYVTLHPIATESRLAALVVRGATLTPVFDKDVTSYEVQVPNSLEETDITATTLDANSSLYMFGKPARSGKPSPKINLSEGSNPVTISVGSQEGGVQTDYNVNIIRADKFLALTGLAASAGTLSPAFDAEVSTYITKVSSATAAITITPAWSSSYQLLINGNTLNSGDTPQPIALNADGTSTNITVQVKAASGAIRNYTVVVQRASANASLATLNTSVGTIAPVFNKDVLAYTLDVTAATSSIGISAVPADTAARVTINGSAQAAAYNNYNVALAYGLNTITVVVSPQDGPNKTYTITVARAQAGSSIATLSSLTTNAGTLNSVAGPSDYNYSVAVASTVTSVTITPVVTDAGATLQVNGVTATSGVATAPIAIAPGANIVKVLVTAADNVTKKSYQITINRALPAEVTLTALTVREGTLSPAFNANTLAYNVSVASTADTAHIKPIKQASTSIVSIDGKTPDANGEIAVPVITGSNPLAVKVTAQDGVTILNYIVTVKRAASPVANLSKLLLIEPTLVRTNVATGPGDFNSVATAPVGTASVRILATPTDAGATMLLNGVAIQSGVPSAPVPLTGDSTSINVQVTAANNFTVKHYVVKVYRPLSNVATLSRLYLVEPAVTRVNEATGPGDYNSSAAVSGNASSIRVVATVTDDGATIKINGVITASGTPSAIIPLTNGSNYITVQVTAQNGVTIKNYSIKVVRPLSSIATLSKLSLVDPNVNRVAAIAGPGDVNSTAIVPSGTTSIKVVALASDAGAAITVNNVSTASGATSAPVALVSDTTLINVRVTAANGITTKVYAVKVIRPISSVATLSKLYLVEPAVARVASSTGLGDYNSTATVSASTSTIRVVAVATDSAATIRVNGTVTASGQKSLPISLTGNPDYITVQVTAADGTTTKSYVIKVEKSLLSSIAILSKLYLVEPAVARTTVSSGPAEYNTTASVSATTKTIKVVAVAADADATIRINGMVTASGVPSLPITLNAGENTINVIVTAQDGVTSHSWAIIVSKGAPAMLAAAPVNKKTDVGVIKKTEAVLQASPEDIIVKQALSPNGDGINDRLAIQGIDLFPDNVVRIMDRSGNVIYEAKGYDNESKAFDGHSSKGAMQQAGTYFYSIEYKKGTELKRKSGYLIIKY
ncbi:cadherin-like beta sandwich domain-containing protein [Mucilaginibacter pedocola]|uniref:Cadherin-like beta-sandwich-like domain-containing protein n=1 Tax=Mucilaginibacter pedocola TaxID=1792845 RepID=A0A1S9PDM0_9SPHI|nr:cadherin-like beta sandwich domain-containing protein [Mucilaginibacter pedocola]OOQ59062.1 hypothetical protein BC343_29545 [Mucilaginibacter pedocola]